MDLPVNPNMCYTFAVVSIKFETMKIRIKSCIEGARQAKGLTIIIDVFRSSNTIIASLAQGADYVIPVGKLEEAYRLKKAYPRHLLIGERKSQTPEGFDFGNSPSRIASMDMKNKQVILTTSAGTQGIVSATGADEILIASFANAASVLKYIHQKNPSYVTLAPMGFESSEKAEEDEQCALYLKEQLEGKTSNFEAMKKKMLSCKGAERLRSIGREDDLHYALLLDIHPIVPRFNRDNQKLEPIHP